MIVIKTFCMRAIVAGNHKSRIQLCLQAAIGLPQMNVVASVQLEVIAK